MANLTVGTGQQFNTIAAAIAASHDGDTVLVQAGTYVDDFAIIKTKITLQSVGGLAILQANSSPPNGKAILTTDADVTIDGFGFTGARVSDNNGAGIRYETGNLTVRNSVFWNNQEGILGAANPTGKIVIDGSEFSNNGAGDGYTHNLYIGEVASLLVQNSYFHDAAGGHEIKSRAHSNTIINNRIFDNNGDASYSIDLPNGGTGLIGANVIEKGVNAPNYTTIHFGGEGTPYAGSALSIVGNTVVNDNPNGALLNDQAAAPVVVSNNSLWNLPAAARYQGTTAKYVTESGTVTLAARPALDLSSKAPAVPLVIPPPVTAVPLASDYVDFGPAGAVLATGRVLSVGSNAQFKTLGAALAYSADGDTIQVAAGTYSNDFGTVNHKVIIEGVGGIAKFVQTGWGGPDGILTVNADATLRNLSFSGAHGGANQHEAGISINAGNVTVSNSAFTDNDIGIYARDNMAGSLAILGSEIGGNGNADKGTHNLTVGQIGSLTIRNSYVHGAWSGHEISERAVHALIDGNRIIDGPGVGTSMSIVLGFGGDATVTNNVIEKGRGSQNDNLILVGGEGPAYSNTKVAVNNNTLISDMVWPDHPYTFFISADAKAATVGPITGSGDTFIGGVPGSAQGTNVALTNSKVAGTATLDTTSPVSAALAPAAIRRGTGPNTLLLTLAGAATGQAAQFGIAIDGIGVGSGILDATKGAAAQDFSFTGTWSAGAHKVTLTGLNLSGDGSASGASSVTLLRAGLENSAFLPTTVLTNQSPSTSFTLWGTTIVPEFDANYYVTQNPDVRAAGVDPLQHYLSVGWKEGRNPSALFDTREYLARNPDVAAAGINPLQHYETNGWLEGRDPSSLFSLRTYYAAHPETLTGNTDPLQLAMQSGDTRSYADPLFDLATYDAARPGAPTTLAAARNDFDAGGWGSGAQPSAWFNSSYYLWANPDVAAAGVNPLAHYETAGWHEGRDANPWFSASAYAAANPGKVTAGIDPLLTFLTANPGALPQTSAYLQPEARAFDAAFYLAKNPDVKAAGMDPLYHYERFGWTEGRDPSAAFSTKQYLAHNPDVAAAHIDPLAHYVNNGQSEGRAIYPA